MIQTQIVLHPLFLMRLIHMMRQNRVREAIELAGKMKFRLRSKLMGPAMVTKMTMVELSSCRRRSACSLSASNPNRMNPTSRKDLRSLMRSLGEAGNQVDEGGKPWTWLRALEMSESFSDLRRHLVWLNDPDRGFFINAVRRRAGTASTGEFWLLMGIASLSDFGHIADKLCKKPWQGFYGRLDDDHARALAACVYHAAAA